MNTDRLSIKIKQAQHEFMMKSAQIISRFIPVMQKERVQYILTEEGLSVIETPLQKDLKYQIEILKSIIIKHYELSENDL